MERFVKLVSRFYPLTISTKNSVLDVWQGSEYIPGFSGPAFIRMGINKSQDN